MKKLLAGFFVLVLLVITPVLAMAETTMEISEAEDARNVKIGANGGNSWDTAHVIFENRWSKDAYSITLTKRNKYSNVINLPYGSYKVIDVVDEDGESSFSIKNGYFDVTPDTEQGVLIDITHNKQDGTFMKLLKKNVFFLIVLPILLVVYAYIRHEKGLPLFDRKLKKSDEYEKDERERKFFEGAENAIDVDFEDLE